MNENGGAAGEPVREPAIVNVGFHRRLGRREFVLGTGAAGLLAGCGRLPWQAEARAKTPRIGWLWSTGINEASLAGFLQGLHAHGYVDGENVVIVYRVAEGQFERLPNLAADLVHDGVDVIVASGGSVAIDAARRATTSLPIVMTTSGDPVRSGFVASLARPGGNVTGLSLLTNALRGKRLALLKETIPSVTRVGMLGSPATTPEVIRSEMDGPAQSLSVALQWFEIQSVDDFESAFDAAIRNPPDGLVVADDALFVEHRARIVEFAARQRLPAVYGVRQFVEAGGLMAYGTSVPDLYRRAAYYVDRILKGTKPADLPVEQPMTFDFVVNLKTAQSLGITFPNEIMLQVTEVIQ